MQPFNAEDDGENILLPVVWNQCLFDQEKFSCSIKCPSQLGRYFDFPFDSV